MAAGGAGEGPAELLSLDLGNTSLKGVLWQAGEASGGFRLAGVEEPDPALVARCRAARRVLLVSVRDARADALASLDLVRVERVGDEIPAPGHVCYDEPAQMGLDRRVAAYAALRLYGPGIVCDCGTALTLTHVDEELRLRGLAIAPGRAALGAALGVAAPRRAPFIAEAGQPGPGLPRGTADNLAFGLGEGWASLLRGLLAALRPILEAEGCGPGTLLLTGSDAEAAQAALGQGRVVEGLVHEGLRLLAQDTVGA